MVQRSRNGQVSRTNLKGMLQIHTSVTANGNIFTDNFKRKTEQKIHSVLE